MMKNKILDTEIVVKTHRVIEAQEIPGTDFVYYEDIKEINKNGKEHTEKNTGFTSKENILAVSELNPISWKIKAPKMYDNIATIAAIKKSNFNSVLKGKKHITEVIEPANEISYPVTEDYMLVLWNGASHKIANLNYDFIPIPISFGYIDGSIDNEIYNLDKLLDILKNDEPLVLKSRKDCIPYYPYVIGASFTTNGIGTIRLSSKSWVDIEEERYGHMSIHDYYRNELKKELEESYNDDI